MYHIVDGSLQLPNLSTGANVDGLGEISIRDGLGDGGDFSDL